MQNLIFNVNSLMISFLKRLFFRKENIPVDPILKSVQEFQAKQLTFLWLHEQTEDIFKRIEDHGKDFDDELFYMSMIFEENITFEMFKIRTLESRKRPDYITSEIIMDYWNKRIEKSREIIKRSRDVLRYC